MLTFQRRLFSTGSRPRWSGQNVVEKIVQKYAVNLPPGHLVRSGEFVSIRPAYVMTHDNTAAVMSKSVYSLNFIFYFQNEIQKYRRPAVQGFTAGRVHAGP